MAHAPVLLWLRRNLRLYDNPALAAAAQCGAPVIPVFVHQSESRYWPPGPASQWWLGCSVTAFAASLAGIGGWLVVRSGDPVQVLPALARETGASAVYLDILYEPHAAAADAHVARALLDAGVSWHQFKGNLLHEPWERRSRTGKPYQVFASFWKSYLEDGDPAPPIAAPERIDVPERRPADDVPTEAAVPPASARWPEEWKVGETAAQQRLDAFLQDGLARYAVARDMLDQHGTSGLSPHLVFGEISPRQIWLAVRAATLHSGEAFLRELGWREFCYYMLYQSPELPDQPLRPEFTAFPWADDDTLFAAWRDGRTGYPIVDAGMRALQATGWLHNRLRMIVASFLVKDLLLPWQMGEAWFWRSLVDADLACNAANWQWVAGCGMDAAPYFRIFNPVLQGEKFDARGRFVRRWVPEIAALPDLFIHHPDQAPAEALAKAGIRMGETYPRPIVNHTAARRRALAAYEQMRRAA